MVSIEYVHKLLELYNQLCSPLCQQTGISQTSLILAKVIRSFLPTFIGLGIFITPYILNKLLCVAVYYYIIYLSNNQANFCVILVYF